MKQLEKKEREHFALGNTHFLSAANTGEEGGELT